MSRKTRVRPVLIALALSAVMSARALAENGFDANGQCVGDADGNAQVTVDEVIVAVNNVLGGCQFTPVTLQFRAAVGSEPFTCGNIYHGIGTSNADIVPSDFRFYVYNVRLVPLLQGRTLFSKSSSTPRAWVRGGWPFATQLYYERVMVFAQLGGAW